jgi:hypothetical protein
MRSNYIREVREISGPLLDTGDESWTWLIRSSPYDHLNDPFATAESAKGDSSVEVEPGVYNFRLQLYRAQWLDNSSGVSPDRVIVEWHDEQHAPHFAGNNCEMTYYPATGTYDIVEFTLPVRPLVIVNFTIETVADEPPRDPVMIVLWAYQLRPLELMPREKMYYLDAPPYFPADEHMSGAARAATRSGGFVPGGRTRGGIPGGDADTGM